MPLPGNYSTRTVTGTILDLHDGTAAAGTVKFTPELTNLFITDAGADTIIAPTSTIATLDVNGAFSVTLGTTDDPDISPNGWTYRVEITTSDSNANGQHVAYSIQLPAGGSVNLADLTPVSAVPGSIMFVKSVNGITPDAAGNVSLIGLLTILNRNSTFEVDVAGWEAVNGAVTRSTAQFVNGVASMLLTPTGGSAAEARTDLTADGSPSVVIGETYFAAGWVRSPTGFATVDIRIDWLNAASGIISSVTSSTVDLIVDRWTYLSVRGVAPALTVKARVTFRETGTPAAGDLLYVDDAIITVDTPPMAMGDLSNVTATATDGNVLRYVAGSSKWESTSALTTTLLPSTTQVFTVNSTWNKPAGLKGVWVRQVGGGASGGGVPLTAAGQAAEGSGGGSGQYAEKWIPAASLGATETVTIGAGGAASAAGGSGSNGGVTSFGAHVTAAGGLAGNAGTATSTANVIAGGLGGTGATSGTFARDGERGGTGRVVNAQPVLTGHGAASALSPVARPVSDFSSGTAGIVYGGGSSGASNGASGVARASLVGASGVCIVIEFY